MFVFGLVMALAAAAIVSADGSKWTGRGYIDSYTLDGDGHISGILVNDTWVTIPEEKRNNSFDQNIRFIINQSYTVDVCYDPDTMMYKYMQIFTKTWPNLEKLEIELKSSVQIMI